MANDLVGNVYVLDSGNQFINPKGLAVNGGGKPIKVNAVSLVFTTTAAVLRLSLGGSVNTILQIDKHNPSSIYLGGVWFDDLMVQAVSAGTGFLYTA